MQGRFGQYLYTARCDNHRKIARIFHYSYRSLVFDCLSYMVTYAILIKSMMMLQAEDREKLSEEEMNQVWGRSYSKISTTRV